MPKSPHRSQHPLQDRLSQLQEITITVTGRKSGRTISNPVWFVLDGDNLCLVPVSGADTQWYKNILKNPSIQIDAGGQMAALKLSPVTDSKQVSSIVEKFRDKYGPGQIKKYYSKLDVAVVSALT